MEFEVDRELILSLEGVSDEERIAIDEFFQTHCRTAKNGMYVAIAADLAKLFHGGISEGAIVQLLEAFQSEAYSDGYGAGSNYSSL